MFKTIGIGSLMINENPEANYYIIVDVDYSYTYIPHIKHQHAVQSQKFLDVAYHPSRLEETQLISPGGWLDYPKKKRKSKKK